MDMCGLNYAQRNRALPGGCASLLIRFSHWEDGAACGKLWSAHSEAPRAFRGLEQLLSEMEAEMERIGRPARTLPPPEMRRVSSEAAPSWSHQGRTGPERGRLCTAAVRVLRRQNGCIQGELQICGTGKQAFFRSARELLLLLQSALNDSQRAEALPIQTQKAE